MTLATISFNLFLIALPLGVLSTRGAHIIRPTLLGALAAGVGLLIAILSRTVPLSPVGRMVVVVAIEEVAKASATVHALDNTPSHVRGATVGVAFATVENLFYLLSPSTTLILRLLGATSLHTVTTLLYGSTYSCPPRWWKTIPVALTISFTLHTIFNSLAIRLDQTLLAW